MSEHCCVCVCWWACVRVCVRKNESAGAGLHCGPPSHHLGTLYIYMYIYILVVSSIRIYWANASFDYSNNCSQGGVGGCGWFWFVEWAKCVRRHHFILGSCRAVLVVAVVVVRRHFYALRLCKLEDATSDENFVVVVVAVVTVAVAVVSQQLCAWAGVLDHRAELPSIRWSTPNPIQDFMHYAMGVSAHFPASRSFPFSFLLLRPFFSSCFSSCLLARCTLLLLAAVVVAR